MYDRAFRKWKEFAVRKQQLSYFHANPMHVAVYLQHVLHSTRSPGVPLWIPLFIVLGADH